MSRLDPCVLFALAFILLPVPVFGQEALLITVTTDKQDYDLGQVVLITVRVQQFGAPVANVVVGFEVRDPQNQVRASGYMITDSRGQYSRQIMIGNDFPLGSYSVYVSVTANGQSASATAVFQTVPEFISGSSLVPLFAMIMSISMLRVHRRRNYHGKASTDPVST